MRCAIRSVPNRRTRSNSTRSIPTPRIIAPSTPLIPHPTENSRPPPERRRPARADKAAAGIHRSAIPAPCVHDVPEARGSGERWESPRPAAAGMSGKFRMGKKIPPTKIIGKETSPAIGPALSGAAGQAGDDETDRQEGQRPEQDEKDQGRPGTVERERQRRNRPPAGRRSPAPRSGECGR